MADCPRASPTIFPAEEETRARPGGEQSERRGRGRDQALARGKARFPLRLGTGMRRRHGRPARGRGRTGATGGDRRLAVAQSCALVAAVEEASAATDIAVAGQNGEDRELRARPQMSMSRGDPRFEEKHHGHCWPGVSGLKVRRRPAGADTGAGGLCTTDERWSRDQLLAM